MKEKSPQKRENTTSRRDFLRFVAAAPAGIVAGEVLNKTAPIIDKQTEKVTDHPLDKNATFEGSSPTVINKGTENEKVVFTQNDTEASYFAAPFEEIVFRAMPSGWMDILSGKIDDAGKNLVCGDREEGLGLTRRETIVGAASGAASWALHSVTSKGLETKNLPATQTVGQMALWYLQRKYGILSNTAAHTWFNVRRLNK